MKTTVGVGTSVDSISLDEIRALAAAMDTQVKRDLKPVWNIDAEVIPLENVSSPPKGVHPIIVAYPTPNNVAGQHYIEQGMTYAFVNAKRNWRLAASHECLEMLVDPTGQRMIPSTGIGIVGGAVHDIDDEFQYIVEVCDPMEDEQHAYAIDGVPVSDFYTQNYFDRAAKPGVRYSFRGTVTRPREVLLGGYVSWWHPKTKTLHQLKNIKGLEIVDLPPWSPDSGTSARMLIDRHTPTPRSRPDLFGREAPCHQSP